jgi:hypothetical protein
MNDLINSVFEAGGACLLWLNVVRLYKDKRLLGVSILPTAWYTLWGFWNIHRYSHLGQSLSWFAAFGCIVVNLICVGMALRYR